MTHSLETRGSSREHVLLLAHMTIDGGSSHYRIRIRDLSATGLSAASDVSVKTGQLVEVDFGAAGKVSGVIAWHEKAVFGVSLERGIDPAVVRRATIQTDKVNYEAPRFVRQLAPAEKSRGPTRKL